MLVVICARESADAATMTCRFTHLWQKGGQLAGTAPGLRRLCSSSKHRHESEKSKSCHTSTCEAISRDHLNSLFLQYVRVSERCCLVRRRYKIAKKLEVHVATLPNQYRRLGHVSLSNNHASQFQSRELKSIHVDTVAKCVDDVVLPLVEWVC